MTNSQRLSTVRDQLIRWMASQSAPPINQAAGSVDSDPILSESILIRDGFYCGRRFDLGTHRAVWFLEEDVLKIYSSQGKLECVLAGEQLGQLDDDTAGRGQVFTLPKASQSSVSADRASDDSGKQGEIRRAA